MNCFAKDDHKIFHGDAVEVLTHHIPDHSVDLIFADPPYNIGKTFNGTKEKWENDEAYIQWCYTWLDLCIKKLKPFGSFYVMTSTQFMPYFDLYIRQKISIRSRIVWAYDSSGVQARKHFGSLYEPILFCVKDPKHYTFNANDILVEARTGAVRKLIDYRKSSPTTYNSHKVPGNVWYIPRVRYRMPEYENHPTQKPIALMERIIKTSSNKDDLVMDPFSGTFTTCFVAKALQRKSIGIEINLDYVKIGLRRLEIQTHLKDERLTKELRSFEKQPQHIVQSSLFEK